jgi:uncharacterized SAM-binding protein YcdF (DUF218 family)
MTIAPPTEQTPPDRRAPARVALGLFILATLVWSVGFVRYTDSIARIEPIEDAAADAVVVLTGGAQRLGAGFRLLGDGRGDRLFVSGVNENVRPSELHALAVENKTVTADNFPDCCVELGFQAQDTKGNAAEIAKWVHAGNVQSLIMVTSNYHMARALVEIRATLPGIRIHPHPVISPTVKLHSWWRWPGSLMLLAGEYHKLLLAGFRVLVQGDA